MTLTAVVFDLDDTLAVTETDRQTLLDQATAAVGAPLLSRQDYLAAHDRHLTSTDREPIFADLLADHETVVSPGDLAAAYRQGIVDALSPIAGAADLLANLRARYALGLLTNGPHIAQDSKLRKLGWYGEFDAVVITGTIEAGKPDERAFQAVLDELDVSPAEAVFVGDDVDKDIQGAKEVGMYTIQVIFPGGPDPDPKADTLVERERLSETLPPLLDSLDTAEASSP